MQPRNYSTLTDHVTEQIRRGMVEGLWRETLPGRDRLAEELGCSHSTVEEALQRLAKKGFLVSQGPGRRRKIQLTGEVIRPRALRIAILLYEPSDRKTGYLVELLHRLGSTGHEAAFAPKTMRDLGMDLKRISRFVEGTEADAWAIVAGSREVLAWFMRRETPVIALFGRHRQINIAGAGVNKAPAYVELVDRLVAMGHRRIVNLVREERRRPVPGFLDRLFLDQLSRHCIQTGPYNLPDWEDSPKGLHTLLDSLFRTTPPTALLLDEPMLFIAARDHLARKGVIAPDHVSLVCCDSDPSFDWCLPQITHIRWDYRLIVQRVVRWADKIGRGQDDRLKSACKAHLVVGGTIGPVPSTQRYRSETA
jgi:biotin operon repressor